MHMLVHCSFTQILKICRSNMKFQAYSILRKIYICRDETTNQLEYPIVDHILYHVYWYCRNIFITKVLKTVRI